MNRLASTVAFILFAIAFAAAQNDAPVKDAAPDVPDAIQVPAGEEVLFSAHASGSQIYTCIAGSDGKSAWTLKAPDTELRDRKDKVIGQHSAGPTWTLKDGSEVTGKAAAHVDSLDSGSIPWLLVNVVSHAGKKGMLTNVNMIQRVHTHGGKPPDHGCDEQNKDSETKVPYTADYFFFQAAK